MATVPVKYFHSGMAGAPVLSGTAGAMIAVLDACLKDGFGLKTVDSLVVASNVATMNISTGHSFEVGSVALVAGATPSSLNGEWRVTAVTTNTVQFATSGISDQTATGTITTKLAPLGWTKPHGTGNFGAYRSANPASPGHYLRVDDSGTNDARVVGYEAMSDINTGTGLFPTAVQITGGLYWHKSSTANSTARSWIVFGDDRLFYYWCQPSDATSVTSQGTMIGFGDVIPQGSADSFYTCLMGAAQNLANIGAPRGPFLSQTISTTTYQVSMPRSYTGIGTAVNCTHYSDAAIGSSFSSQSGNGPIPYPNGPDNGLLFGRSLVAEGMHIRGTLPGFYFLPQAVGFALSTRDVIAGQNDLVGKRLMAVRYGNFGGGQNNTGGTWGCFVMDISGPWR